MENLRSKFTHMLRDEKRCIPVNPVYFKEKKRKRMLHYLNKRNLMKKISEDIHSVLMKGWFLLIYIIMVNVFTSIFAPMKNPSI